MPAGIHHILIGPDHLLFLVGLLLLGGIDPPARCRRHRRSPWRTASRCRSRRSTSSAPPARIIEPAIALSIVYVGADNLLAQGGRDVRGVDCVHVRLHSRIRVRQRAARDGSADARARLVAVLVQRRRGNRPAAGRRARGLGACRACDPAAEWAGRHLALRRVRRGHCWPARSGSFNGCSFLEASHEAWNRAGRRSSRSAAIVAARPRGWSGRASGRGPQGPNVAEIEKGERPAATDHRAAAATPRRSSPTRGVVLVDTKLANWGQAILDKVKSVTEQADHDDHQHAHARRSQRQQRVLRRDGRIRRAGEHQGEHGEDGRLQEATKSVFIPKKTFKDKLSTREGRRPDRPVLLRPGPHQRRCLRCVFARCA